jgi:hypothetical protein
VGAAGNEGGSVTALFCDEHGEVMQVGELKSSWPRVTVTMFCPICQGELFPNDPLTAIERQEQPAATFDDWKGRGDVPVLDMGTVRLPDSNVWRGVYPGMCRDPELCRGRGSCPRDYSCSE